MSKETRKKMSIRHFVQGEFATSKGLRWTGKGLDKSAKFVSEWKYKGQQQGSQDDGSGGSGGKATLGIQDKVDKPNAEDGNALSQENDNSAEKRQVHFLNQITIFQISSMNEQEGSAVLGIKNNGIFQWCFC